MTKRFVAVAKIFRDTVIRYDTCFLSLLVLFLPFPFFAYKSFAVIEEILVMAPRRQDTEIRETIVSTILTLKVI